MKKINILYFGSLFFLITFFSIYSLLSYGRIAETSLFFFSIYSAFQAFLEVFLIVLIFLFLDTYCHKSFSYFFLSLIVLLLLAHFVNFILLSIMDSTFIEMMKIFFAHGIGSLLIALRAANLNSSMLALIACFVLFIPIMGIGFFLLTQRISHKLPITWTKKRLLNVTIFSFLALFVVEFSAKEMISARAYYHLQKRLPFGRTLFSPKMVSILAKRGIKKPKKNSHYLPTCEIAKKQKPNIYLFIVESLRKDCLTDAIAPHLSQFMKDNDCSFFSFSNGNFSPLSWFSIFYSHFPLYWEFYQQQPSPGSPCLQILKKWGYEIHVLSSAELSYFQMDEMILGTKFALATTYREFPKNFPSERDALAIQALKNLLDDSNRHHNQCFIIFLDSTHSEYTWPDHFPQKFSPIVNTIPYLSLSQTKKQLPLVQNRYYNAISYIDSLFSSFLSTLENKNIQDDAITIFTADHGEEFFEQGSLFHNSHLNYFQTSIPIIYHFPTDLKPKCLLTSLSSHVDIFPTLFHVLTGKEIEKDFFNGQSIYSEKRFPYVISAAQNGAFPPKEISILNEKKRILIQIEDPKKLFEKNQLLIWDLVSVMTDSSYHYVPKQLQEEAEKDFQQAFDHLFE